MTLPDFRSMTGPQLLQEYNKLSDKPRKAKFSDRAEGIKRCEEAWAKRKPAPATDSKPSSRDLQVIRLLTDQCPRRSGSDGAIHWEAMRGGITVEEYASKFQPADRRRARQWLWNTVKDGYATLLPS